MEAFVKRLTRILSLLLKMFCTSSLVPVLLLLLLLLFLYKENDQFLTIHAIALMVFITEAFLQYHDKTAIETALSRQLSVAPKVRRWKLRMI